MICYCFPLPRGSFAIGAHYKPIGLSVDASSNHLLLLPLLPLAAQIPFVGPCVMRYELTCDL